MGLPGSFNHAEDEDDHSAPSPQPEMPPPLPALPPLSATDILQVFALPPISGDANVDGVNLEAFDLDRFAFLGSGAIQFAVSHYLFNESNFSNAEIQRLRAEYTQSHIWGHWASLYDNFANINHVLGESEAPKLFSAYVGGLYHQDDLKTVETWINQLIVYTQSQPVPVASLNSPTTEQITPGALLEVKREASSASSVELPSSSTPAPDQHLPTSTRSRKREREVASGGDSGRSSPSPKRTRISSTSAGPSTPHPPIIGEIIPLEQFASELGAAPAPPPVASSSSAPGTSQQQPPQKKWMSVLNEGCHATKCTMDLKFETDGVRDNNVVWKAILTVSQFDVAAVGRAKSKKLAQEEAAEKACQRLKWTREYKW
ncbi:hypothetical protein FRB90_002029 [Tulasnella sp. 427]|nr:hypothetical protein FRB90_002029 [Tulasnella sp. 427]